MLKTGNREDATEYAPWWAWLLPACTFLLFLTLFWPRPYAIPAGDGLTYYSGARHIASQGRYYSDYDYRPAVPITRHPPLLSMLWGTLLYLGLSPAQGLWLIHAGFLAAMGAAGGAAAFRITRCWIGPLVWTLFSCGWPGGDNWIYWVRPQTESGTAALFVVVVWMLSCALRAQSRRAVAWLLSASIVAGLSMILKVTGAFCFPVVGAVAFVIAFRSQNRSRWWVVPASLLLMILPYALWAWRNVTIIGAVEAGKISHEPELIWGLMAKLTADVAAWFLPAQLAQSLSATVHPLVIMLPLVVLPIVLTAQAWRQKCPEAAIAGACTTIAFAALALMMTSKFTEETRYWSVMLPSLALSVLVLGQHGSQSRSTRGLAFRLTTTLFMLFCCARFAITRPDLWYATPAGFYVQQLFLAVSLIVGVWLLHRRDITGWRLILAMALSACVAVAFWRFAHTRPATPTLALASVALLGVVPALPLGRSAGGTAWRCLLCLALLGFSWWQGGWKWIRPDQPLIYELDGILVEVRPDVLRARQIIKQGDWPERFVSNCEEYMIDLFGDHAVLPLPWYRSIARFRSGMPQLPEDDERVKREWLAELRSRNMIEPFVMIILPRWPPRSYGYGPADFKNTPGIEVDWRVRDEDLHIAVCRLSRK